MNTPLFIGNLGATEMILIVVVLLLLFGGRKLPELMRGAGRGIREFKNAMNGDEKPEEKADPSKKEDSTESK